jgi:hypothetical protein
MAGHLTKKPRGDGSQHRINLRQGDHTAVDLEVIEWNSPKTVHHA